MFKICISKKKGLLLMFELEIIKWLQEVRTPIFNFFFEAITFLGEETVMIVVIAFIYFLVNKKIGEKISFTLFGTLLINNSLKGIFDLPRPFEVSSEVTPLREQTATGASFPSGHTQNSSTFYTSIGLYIKKKWVWIVIGVVLFLIGFSRLYLGVHFPKDILSGWMIGIGWGFLGWILYDKYAVNFQKKMILFLIQLAIFTPLLFFYESFDMFIKVGVDFYKAYAIYLGFILAIFLENKFVNFSTEIPNQKKALRFGIAILVLFALQMGLSSVFPDGLIFTMLRYFLVSFVGLGVYPIVFTKLGF